VKSETEKTFTRTWYEIIDGKPTYTEVELTQAEIDGLEKQREMRLARENNIPLNPPSKGETDSGGVKAKTGKGKDGKSKSE